VTRNLFGFHFEVFGDKGDGYRMTHVNESKDNFLMFRYESSTGPCLCTDPPDCMRCDQRNVDKINMLETPYAHKFDEELNMLQEHNSWPLFFAAVIQKTSDGARENNDDDDSAMDRDD
jgi:hypothetical protein